MGRMGAKRIDGSWFMVNGYFWLTVNGFSLKSRRNDRNSRNEPDRQAKGVLGDGSTVGGDGLWVRDTSLCL